MKKIINEVDDIVKESLEGLTACYKKYIYAHPEVNGVLAKEKRQDKVTLVIGGGSGHEPMFAGFLGKGLADAAACGNIFASPDPNTIYETALAAHGGKGILFLYGNYAGDNLNFDMAEEFLQEEGIETCRIRVNDDCASAPKERANDRRGVAGDLFAIKIVGAACDAGLELGQVKAVGEKVLKNLRTIGIATSPGQIPGLSKPTFELGEDEMEYGVGIHGEKGIERTSMKSADEITEYLYANIMKDMPIESGAEICVLVNGLGSTSNLEMNIVYRKLVQLLDRDGISIWDGDINTYCTCQEMGGFSISILKLDEELKQFYNAPCSSPYYTREGKNK